MTTDNQSEYDGLVDGILHWGTIDQICRNTKLPEEVVRQVIESLRCPHIAEDVCKAAGTDLLREELGHLVTNAKQSFWLEACSVIGECRAPEGSGPNFERIFKTGLRAAQDQLESKFA